MFSSEDFSFAQQQHFMLQQVMRLEELENAKGANVESGIKSRSPECEPGRPGQNYDERLSPVTVGGQMSTESGSLE